MSKFLAGAFCGGFVATVLLVMSLYRRPEPEPVLTFPWRDYERVDAV